MKLLTSGVLLFLFVNSTSTFACPAFKFKNLTCENKITGEQSLMKRFELVDRPDYQVLVSEVGPRLRTLVLPFESVDRYGKAAVMSCEDGQIKMTQYYQNLITETYFEIDIPNKTATQLGSVIKVTPACDPVNEDQKNCPLYVEEVPIEVICTEVQDNES